MEAELITATVKIGEDPCQKQQSGKIFPLILSPARPGVNFVELQEYFLQKHTKILLAASEYGAVLFKGFDIANAEEWASVIYQSGLKEMEYIGGAAVRKLVVGSSNRMTNPQIVTTNESPPSEPIPFHHELAQTPNPPDHISFFCLVNDADGGATPLIRSDMIYDYLLETFPEFTKTIEEQGVKYIRVAPEEDDASSALGRSWKSMFNVTTREQAEQEMTKAGATWEWLPGGDCKIISTALPAVRIASNGRKSFLNQVIAAYTGWIDKRNDPRRAVVLAGGAPLDDAVLSALAAHMIANQNHWTPGAFVIVDNTVAAHSRQPFNGRRRILASIAKGIKPLPPPPAPAAAGTHLVLSSGDRMPAVGYGLWKVSKDVCAAKVVEAVRAGYRLFDSACDYGNEQQTGAGLKEALASGLVRREELFVTSKLWNTYHRREHVRAACLKTLADLGLEYLDLYLIHFPIPLKFVPFDERYPPEWVSMSTAGAPRMEEDAVPYRETWEAMEQLVDEGLVRNIGACNIGTLMLRDVLSYARIKPAVLQVELHPQLTQDKLLRFCRERGVAVTAFSSFGGTGYVEMGMAAPDDSVLGSPVVRAIADRVGKTPAQVVLRWAVQRGTAVIPKTLTPSRMAENLDLFSFALAQADMAAISALNQNRRFNDPGHFCEAAFGTFFPIYE
eukprot:CAMPEP_0172211824 /NCGR_PEP_ID=MMETSP1050-20130122/36628_1 /TAXON_ID=233186 /ORGANISM="Cryptomonas curvata, Strain CCAP979/52" /LENGTH=673 /DNA_ID=CAMNT_0012892341 /DNA_START=9 /DNA_END=2031 /DNA_ORIENTATION=+